MTDKITTTRLIDICLKYNVLFETYNSFKIYYDKIGLSNIIYT